MQYKMSLQHLRSRLPGAMQVSKPRSLRSRVWRLFLSCRLERSPVSCSLFLLYSFYRISRCLLSRRNQISISFLSSSPFFLHRWRRARSFPHSKPALFPLVKWPFFFSSSRRRVMAPRLLKFFIWMRILLFERKPARLPITRDSFVGTDLPLHSVLLGIEGIF